jgi:hypothetical protein
VQFRDCRSDFDQLPLEFQKNLVDLISHLQDQIKPIRVYLAVETKSGPLGGLAAQIEGMTSLEMSADMSNRRSEHFFWIPEVQELIRKLMQRFIVAEVWELKDFIISDDLNDRV